MTRLERGYFNLCGFPLPPSVNTLYRNLPAGRGRAKTQKYRTYENTCRIWMLQNQNQLWQARALAMDAAAQPFSVLRVDSMFYFEASRILTMAGKPKRNDSSNYLKAPLDMLAQMLHIDDSYFWSGFYDKEPVDHPEYERVDFRLTLVQIK